MEWFPHSQEKEILHWGYLWESADAFGYTEKNSPSDKMTDLVKSSIFLIPILRMNHMIFYR